MARTEPAETTHDLTTAMINDLIRGYRRDRQAAVEALVKIEERRAAGVPEPKPLSDIEKLARERAIEVINGAGTANMFLPPPASREQQLQVEIRSLDLVLDALGQRETEQRAVEAVHWQRQHGEAWRKLCHDILLTAVRLASLEYRAAAMMPDMFTSVPLSRFIGGRSVLNVNWSSDPLAPALRDALAEHIISERELAEAQR